MPRGGRRIGSGRKSGGATKKTREIADTAAVRGVKLPLEYMLAVLGDETASPARRDAMAIASAAYCHPRLSAVGISNHVPGGGGGSNVSLEVQIYAVPRGAKFESDGTITIDGEAVTELPSIGPYRARQP